LISQKKIFEELIKKDNKLKVILDAKKKCPFLKTRHIDEELLFFELSQSIVGQQISAKAAEAIWGRIVDSSKKENSFIKAMAKSNLMWARTQGLSQRKHEYIKSTAKSILSNKLSLEAIENLSNKEAIEFLSSIKGIGPWTAEMFLMFAYRRLDVFSIGDIALRRAISKVYEVDDSDHEKMIRISKKWKPYRSVVCWYLWEYLGV
tara:strand:+ start:25 stop:639 length:615 start_codon:yes stop_codon:yes gene_type:complete